MDDASILHVTPHMGGGVGRVLKHFVPVSSSTGPYRHSIACLDYANADALAWAGELGVDVRSRMAEEPGQLADLVAGADIVHLHWWNHPLTYAFLDRADLPAFRSVTWAHVNGYHAPHQILGPVLDYPDLFVLGTPYSRAVPAVRKQHQSWRAKSLRAIFASSGYAHVEHVKPVAHDGFRVGYIGTVDYGKMHREYLQMHAAAEVAEMKVFVCGGARETELQAEAESFENAERFEIRGHIQDVGQALAEFDVFGYPLQSDHYGASEVALIEAMVCGVVPVVLANGCESHIVDHQETGIVAQSPTEFTAALEYLARNPNELARMSAAASSRARDRFHISTTVAGWHRVYEETLWRPKSRRQLTLAPRRRTDARMSQLLVASLGESEAARIFHKALHAHDDRAVIQSLAGLAPIYQGTSNGSPFQYRQFFPNDPGLQRLCCLLEEARGLSESARQTAAAA